MGVSFGRAAIQPIIRWKFRSKGKKSEKEGYFIKAGTSPFSAKYTRLLGQKSPGSWQRNMFSCSIRCSKQIKDQVLIATDSSGN